MDSGPALKHWATFSRAYGTVGVHWWLGLYLTDGRREEYSKLAASCLIVVATGPGLPGSQARIIQVIYG